MKKIVYFILFLFGIFLLLVLKPIDSSAANSVKVSGTVEAVTKGGSNDLVFHLKNDSQTYYINRGIENGFPLASSQKKFTGKKVKLFYAKNWTPLAPFGNPNKHISHLVCDDVVVYSEWE